jgi:short-subunit dehydrogenase
VTGHVGIPGRSTYSAAKHALHGYFDALRAEIWRENIQVLLVVPGYIKTNISFNALTESGLAQNKMDDGQANGIMPDVLAQKILKAISANKEELHVAGLKETTAMLMKRFFPGLFSKIVRKAKTT